MLPLTDDNGNEVSDDDFAVNVLLRACCNQVAAFQLETSIQLRAARPANHGAYCCLPGRE
jgi:hypothetical protein